MLCSSSLSDQWPMAAKRPRPGSPPVGSALLPAWMAWQVLGTWSRRGHCCAAVSSAHAASSSSSSVALSGASSSGRDAKSDEVGSHAIDQRGSERAAGCSSDMMQTRIQACMHAYAYARSRQSCRLLLQATP